jgi:hypothetical protein
MPLYFLQLFSNFQEFCRQEKPTQISIAKKYKLIYIDKKKKGASAEIGSGTPL